jgi:hypothetical protein
MEGEEEETERGREVVYEGFELEVEAELLLRAEHRERYQIPDSAGTSRVAPDPPASQEGEGPS